jgi:hypothetical protein
MENKMTDNKKIDNKSKKCWSLTTNGQHCRVHPRAGEYFCSLHTDHPKRSTDITVKPELTAIDVDRFFLEDALEQIAQGNMSPEKRLIVESCADIISVVKLEMNGDLSPTQSRLAVDAIKIIQDSLPLHNRWPWAGDTPN